MTNPIKLQDVIDQLDELNDDQVIFARKPLSLESEAEIGILGSDFKVPEELSDRGLCYFLEVSVAREALEVFGEHSPTLNERRALLMYYAEHDAYPEWVFGS